MIVDFLGAKWGSSTLIITRPSDIRKCIPHVQPLLDVHCTSENGRTVAIQTWHWTFGCFSDVPRTSVVAVSRTFLFRGVYAYILRICLFPHPTTVVDGRLMGIVRPRPDDPARAGSQGPGAARRIWDPRRGFHPIRCLRALANTSLGSIKVDSVSLVNSNHKGTVSVQIIESSNEWK